MQPARPRPFMRAIVVALLLLLCAPPLARAQDEVDPEEILLDATFVPCSDTTESLLILQDGRAVYALGNRGASFTVAEALLADLHLSLDSAQSYTDTTGLDSCTTLGLILNGPRFLLINTSRPKPQIRELYAKIERIRKFAERRLDGTVERFAARVQAGPDTSMEKPATYEPLDFRRRVRMSPVAREWRCNGTVVVAALVTNKGQVSQAFVQRVRARGKCASLLTTTALRAVLLTSFEPASNRKGRPMATWMEIEVPFARPKPGN